MIAAVLALAVAEALGLALFCALCREPAVWPRAARFGLAHGLGLVALSLLLFALSLAGLRVLPISGVAAAALAWGVLAIWRPPSLGQLWAPSPPAAASGRGVRIALGAMLVLQLGTASAVSLLEPLVEWDVLMLWAIKAKVALHQPLVSAELLRDPTVAYVNAEYPLLWPLALAWVWSFGGAHTLEAAKVLGPASLLALAAVLHGLLRRRVGATPALAAVAIVVGLPMVQIQLGRLSADGVLAYFLVAAAGTGFLWIEDDRRDDLRLAGVLTAGVAFTKIEGTVLLFVLAVAVAAALLWRREPRRLWVAAPWLLALPLVAIGPWLAFRTTVHRRIVAGYELSSERIARLPELLVGAPEYFGNPVDWLVFWPVVAVVLLASAYRSLPRAPSLWIVFAGAWGLYLSYFLVSTWSAGAILETALSRLTLQVTPLAALLAAESLRAAGVLAAPQPQRSRDAATS